jgi:pyruvate kinase
MSSSEPFANRARTKIVATVGPASQTRAMLEQLVAAGVDVFRLNMAHGTLEGHLQAVLDIRRAADAGGRPVGILVDLAGPKIRLGEVSPEPLSCPEGAEFHFVRGAPQAPNELTSTYEKLVDELTVGDRILLADGSVEMTTVRTTPDAAICRVTSPGAIRSRQGINLPGVRLSVPAMSDVDREHACWAAQQEVDFIGLSFVRNAAEVQGLKQLLRECDSPALAVAKIEKPEALENLESIVQAADAVMVARGDLGVEIDVAETPVQQKRIIDACRRWTKPVIVATEMLDSMQHSTRPTRAEVTDVANAIFDGTDACMLSGETAVGEYPLEAVRMMNRIMLSTEKSLRQIAARRDTLHPLDSVHPITSAVVAAAGSVAEQLEAKMVVIATRSGATALTKAKQRDFTPTIAVSDQAATLRQMSLYWGIFPLAGAPQDSDLELIAFVVPWGRRNGLLEPTDRVVVVTGSNVRPGVHNQLIVHEVDE